MKFIKKYKNDILFLSSVIIIVSIISYNFSILFVNGESMEPTYHDKDVLLLNKEHNPKNNQIIIFNSPKSWGKEGKTFIKRILASPGDKVVISNEQLMVNNKVITEITEKHCQLDKPKEFTMKENHYLAVGDNHANSNDSLAQLCKGNGEFLVPKENVLLTGKEIKVLGGSKNEQEK